VVRNGIDRGYVSFPFLFCLCFEFPNVNIFVCTFCFGFRFGDVLEEQGGKRTKNGNVRSFLLVL
jgi:hypothetical protein